MKTARKYSNPPIVEVVCDFRFRVKDPNDLTVPGRFYERIQKDYPVREELHEFEVGLVLSQKELQQKLRTKLLGMQYRTEDGKHLIRVAPDLVSAHRLSPYLSWEDFFPKVELAFKTFLDIVQPEGLERVGLRYIDRVVIPTTSFELSEYFLIYPKTPDGTLANIAQFFMRLEIPFHEERDRLIIMLHNPPESTGETTFIILDWDYVLVQPAQVSIDEVLKWLDEAHDRVVEVFESSITDSCRQLFEEVK